MKLITRVGQERRDSMKGEIVNLFWGGGGISTLQR